MMPRIEAGEKLQAVHAAQLAQPVSGGSEIELERAIEERQAMLGRIQARAEGREPDAIERSAEPPRPADLAAIGIAVTPLPAASEEPTSPSSSAAVGEQDHG